MSIVNIDERREEVEYDCRGMTEGFLLQPFFPMNSRSFCIAENLCCEETFGGDFCRKISRRWVRRCPMETDHYTSLAYYRLIENADRRELPRISGTAYSLFGTEFNDQDELAGIFTQLVEQTISLEGKKIYLSIVLRRSYSSEKMYHYHKLWRYLKRW